MDFLNEAAFVRSPIDLARETKPLVIFGAGQLVRKITKHASGRVLFAVDNNPVLWGSVVSGVEVFSPEKLRQSPDVLVVISSSDVDAISAQLIHLGFSPIQGFCVIPQVKAHLGVSRMRQKSFSFLITVGSSGEAGGLYMVDFPSGHSKRLLSGPTHGLCRFSAGWLATSDEYGLVQLDENLDVLSNVDLRSESRPHGVAVSEDQDLIAVALSNRDEIQLFDEGFNEIRRLRLSEKIDSGSGPQHHVNDVAILDGVVFASMFSLSGNWKRGVFDGGIWGFSAHDLARDTHPVASNLSMPHSVMSVGGLLYVLDSLRGRVLRVPDEELLHEAGFVRGADVDSSGRFWLIGQSRDRNISGIESLPLNRPIDSSVVHLDRETGFSTRVQLPEMDEIHAVRFLDSETITL